MWKLTCIAASITALGIGCGKSADPSPAAVVTQTPAERCKAAIDNAMERSKDEIAKANPTMAGLVPTMAAAMVKHCTEDKWSADATKCLVAAGSYAATEECQGMLTGEQLKRLNDDLMTIVTPASGAPH